METKPNPPVATAKELREGLHGLKIFTGEHSRVLGEKIAQELGVKLGESELIRFKDGEIQPVLKETVRGAYVFIIQSLTSSEAICELLLMIDAAYRASAYKVIAVVPYYAYARQDRKDKARVPIGAKLLANMISAANASRIMTMDLHAGQIQGFFNIPLDHLFASSVFVPFIKENFDLSNVIIASPDIGGSKRAERYADFLQVPLAISFKSRKEHNKVDKIIVIGDVEGKDVIIVDDIIDTGGTLIKVVDIMKQKGAKSVYAFISHGVLSDNAVQLIENSQINTLYITDTIPQNYEKVKNSKKIKIISIARHFAEIIWRSFQNRSISEIFIEGKK